MVKAKTKKAPSKKSTKTSPTRKSTKRITSTPVSVVSISTEFSSGVTVRKRNVKNDSVLSDTPKRTPSKGVKRLGTSINNLSAHLSPKKTKRKSAAKKDLDVSNDISNGKTKLSTVSDSKTSKKKSATKVPKKLEVSPNNTNSSSKPVKKPAVKVKTNKDTPVKRGRAKVYAKTPGPSKSTKLTSPIKKAKTLTGRNVKGVVATKAKRASGEKAAPKKRGRNAK